MGEVAVTVVDGHVRPRLPPDELNLNSWPRFSTATSTLPLSRTTETMSSTSIQLEVLATLPSRVSTSHSRAENGSIRSSNEADPLLFKSSLMGEPVLDAIRNRKGGKRSAKKNVLAFYETQNEVRAKMREGSGEKKARVGVDERCFAPSFDLAAHLEPPQAHEPGL